MTDTKRNGVNGARTSTEPKTEVEYIRLNERQVIIRTTRPGERPVETVAAVFPDHNGHKNQ
jgi:hypothetical protein